MISTKKLKNLAKDKGKKLSDKAIKKIENILEEKASEILRKAKLNADFSGRTIIKEEDIVK